jgi:hypothetical protein
MLIQYTHTQTHFFNKQDDIVYQSKGRGGGRKMRFNDVMQSMVRGYGWGCLGN